MKKTPRKAKKGLIFLSFLLLIGLCFTSCSVLSDNGYLTEEELNEILEGRLDGSAVIEGGDNYDIDINTNGQDNISAASKALLSSVSVQCVYEKYVTNGWGAGASVNTKEEMSLGSGVIIELDKEKGNAYILTNYHVVFDSKANTANGISDKITVMLYGAEVADSAIPATYVGGSMEYDLALLKITASKILAESPSVACTFANSDDISVLDTAIAIGNPEGNGISATVGYVNVDSEYISMTGADGVTEVRFRVIRTDAAVNNGNSGGGLFNHKGELIGIVNAKMSTSTVDNIGYAIPSNVALYVANNIKHYCDGTDRESVYRCIIGITVTADKSYSEYNTENGKVYKKETVTVTAVSQGSAADGIVKAGDILKSITIDGKSYNIDRTFKVVDSMLNARVGSSVTLEVERGGQKLYLNIPITSACLAPQK